MNTSSRLLRSTVLGAILAATPLIAGSGSPIGWPAAHAAPGANNAGGNGGGNGAANANANAGGTHANANAAGASSNGAASNGQLNSAMGALNAAHASSAAMAHAAPGSTVGKISTYDKSMLAALALPSATPAQIAARNTAISNARLQLASTTNKSLTPAVITKVDLTLGLPATDPTLGTAQ